MNKKTEALFHKLAMTIIVLSAICMAIIVAPCLASGRPSLDWEIVCVPFGILIIVLTCLVFKNLSYYVRMKEAIKSGEPTVSECEIAVMYLAANLEVLDAAISNGIYIASRIRMDARMSDVLMESLRESSREDAQSYERGDRLNRSLSMHCDSCGGSIVPLIQRYERDLRRLRQYARRDYLPNELLQRIDALICYYESKNYSQQSGSLPTSVSIANSDVETDIS